MSRLKLQKISNRPITIATYTTELKINVNQIVKEHTGISLRIDFSVQENLH